MHQKLNIFQLNVKLFNVSGIIPSENIKSSLWKSALFRIFQTLSLLLFISMFTLQFLAIYHYWGNINLVANNCGVLSAFLGLCFTSFCKLIKWQDICDVTDTSETNSKQKHVKILSETLNLANIYNKVISSSMSIVPLFFILPTFVQNLITSHEEILQEVATADGSTKYSIVVIWFPPGLKQEFIFRVIYGIQYICFWEICLMQPLCLSTLSCNCTPEHSLSLFLQ